MSNRSEMIFRAEASSRYHRRRAAFLEHINLFLTLVLLAAGGGTFLTLVAKQNGWAAYAGLLVTAIGLIQLIYKPETCAARHRIWLKQWSDILAEARSSDNPAPEQVASWVQRQHQIESECIYELAALKAECFNQTARALDREAEPYHIRWYQRLFIHLLSFEGSMEKDAVRIREVEQRSLAHG